MTDMKENETEDERLERIVRKVVQDEVGNRVLWIEKTFVGMILIIIFGLSLVISYEGWTSSGPGEIVITGWLLFFSTIILAFVFTGIFLYFIAAFVLFAGWIADKTIYD